MKKLMVTAAVAAMIGGAYAGNVCVDESDGNPEGCLVYDLKIKVKTLLPKKGKCKDSGSTCKDDCSVVYYLDSGNRTFKGYIWFCDDECWDVGDDSHIVLWDEKTKDYLIPIGWDWKYDSKGNKSGKKYYYETQGLEFTFLGRYGKKVNKGAAAWSVDSTIATYANGDSFLVGSAAGVGGSLIKDKEGCTAKLKSISGNFAGLASIAKTNGKTCNEITYYGLWAHLCDCVEGICDLPTVGEDSTAGVPASGTWSLKYNKKLSLGSKAMFQIVPKYALLDESAE